MNLKLKKILLSVSLLLFVISLFLPCLALQMGIDSFTPEKISGFIALITGWMAFGNPSVIAWFANFPYLVILISFTRGVYKFSLFASIIAAVLSLFTFSWAGEILGGAYFWLASIWSFALIQILDYLIIKKGKFLKALFKMFLKNIQAIAQIKVF